MRAKRQKGLILVVLGAVFWGIGGTLTKKLFMDSAVTINWLVAIRLLIAGFLLLAVQFFTKDRSQIWVVWKSKKNAAQLIIFGIIGMLGVQYTYMASINHGNAAVATLLQYLAPLFIIGYLLLSRQSSPSWTDCISVCLGLAGSFFLLTNGSFTQLSVPPPAVFWGILSGLALAFYTLYAAALLKQYDSLVIVGWAMMIGGISLSFVHPPWLMNFKSLTAENYIYLLFVVIFGTMIAFWFYIESLQTLFPKETSLLGSVEPLAAVATTVFWLKEPFGSYQWLGTLCIIGVVLLLAIGKKPDPAEKQAVMQGGKLEG
ncbi:DMT family transporter [Peribacillus sp. SCS-37]|uniref:DMT family transporter n=1 Tax=Paraperibacillus esterisolvens TaxID=3115296 RepID=UPI003905DD57